MKIINLILTAVLLFVCKSSFANDKTTNPTFNWPIPSSAKVVQETTKKGKTIKFSYKVNLNKKEGQILVTQEDVKLLEFQGKIVSKVQAQQESNLLGAYFPDIIVDNEGQPVEVIEFDEYLERVTKHVKDPKTLAFIYSPKIKEMLYSRSFENWCAWACSWMGTSIPSGKPLVEIVPKDVMGSSLPEKWVTETEDKTVDGKPVVSISVNSLMEFDQESINKIMSEMVEVYDKTGAKRKEFDPKDIEALKGLKRETSLEIFVEPGSFKPISVNTKSTTSMNNNGKITQTAFESTSYVFDWIE